MKFKRTIFKQGSSLVIGIPAELSRSWNVKPGTTVYIEPVENGKNKLIITWGDTE